MSDGARTVALVDPDRALAFIEALLRELEAAWPAIGASLQLIVGMHAPQTLNCRPPRRFCDVVAAM